MDQRLFIISRTIISVFIFIIAIAAASAHSFALASSGAGINQPIFIETFDNKSLENGVIKDATGQTLWTIDRADDPDKKYDFYNTLTEKGTLILGGSEKNQSLQAVVKEKLPLHYGVHFDFKVLSMANAGVITKASQERPILSFIPRASDNSLKDYYAVLYYLENNETERLLANLFKCKWELVRVTRAKGMEVLTSGYFMVNEHLTYEGALEISNDPKGFVDIAFYLDSPVQPNQSFKPLLSYKDKSASRINTGVTPLTFQVGGFDPAGFQFTPIVELMDIRVYTLQDFRKILQSVSKNYETSLAYLPQTPQNPIYKYLANKGILDKNILLRTKEKGYVSVSDFLVMLLRANDVTYTHTGVNWDKPYIENAMALKLIDLQTIVSHPITDFEMASILYNYSGNKSMDTKFTKILNFKMPTSKEKAVHYAFQQNLIYFNTKTPLSAQKMNLEASCQVIMRLLGTVNDTFNFPLELPHVIGTGSVLQRNKPIPVWGRGMSGDTVTVSFKNTVRKVVVEKGYWRVDLPPEQEGGPYVMSIRDSKSELILKDIFIGEVFLIAGQSNAEWYLKNANDSEETVKNLSSKIKSGELLFRYFAPQQILSLTKNFSTKAYWYNMSEHLLNHSTAVGDFYIEKLISLNNDLKNVPIGMVQLAYGGSTIELFMPEEKNLYPYGPRQHNDAVFQGYWNGFMAGVSPYKFKAAIYYQGENSVQLRYDYERMLNGFIDGFRNFFEEKEMPIILVQLTGYGDSYYDGDTWPIIREIQYNMAKTMYRVELVTAIDLPDEDRWEIHPKNKKPIGERLAYKAMDMLYGIKLGHRSPEMDFYKIEDHRIKLHFEYVEGILNFKEGVSECFEVLAPDGKWYTGSGEIYDQSWVSVTSTAVSNPQGVRYAYHNYPIVSLYDDNMPVFPFNTQKPVASLQKGMIDDFHLFMPYHGLNDWDAVVNHSRWDSFRTVRRIDAFNVSFDFAIKDEAVGDKLSLFKREGSKVLGKGTNQTMIKLTNHGMRAGDWIRNTTRRFADSPVLEIIDPHTFVVKKIEGQRSEDVIEVYKLRVKKIIQ